MLHNGITWGAALIAATMAFGCEGELDAGGARVDAGRVPPRTDAGRAEGDAGPASVREIGRAHV